MKRIVFDISKWSCFLHRAARGLDRAHPGDAPERRFEDELFERLFAGEVESLAESERDAVFAPWAQRIHDTCTQLPAFERLAAECRGSADAAATAVEALIPELAPDAADPELRRSTRTACGNASAAVEQLRDALAGLEHVAFGPAPGDGSDGTPGSVARTRTLAARLKGDQRLKRIAQLAGRFRRIAAAKRRSRVRHGADEIVDIEQGADLARLLPAELARLVHPVLRLSLLRDLVERRCLQYQMTGTETLGRGPLVVCLDKSGSMEGERDIWATAVALALLDVAQAERRPFALLGFDGRVKHESVVAPGEALPESGLFVPCSGGTSIDSVIGRGLDIIEARPGALRRADIVLITDGESSADDAHTLGTRRAAMGVTVLGVAIGIDAASLAPWCDETCGVVDLERLDDRSATALFGKEGP